MKPEEGSVVWGKGSFPGSCYKGDHGRSLRMICMRLSQKVKEYCSKACSCMLPFCGFGGWEGCSLFLLRSFSFVLNGVRAH